MANLIVAQTDFGLLETKRLPVSRGWALSGEYFLKRPDPPSLHRGPPDNRRDTPAQGRGRGYSAMVGVTIRWPAKLSPTSYGSAANRPVLAHIFGSHARDLVAITIAVEELPKIRNHSGFIAARQPL
jgi:hypothetical protein